MNEGLDQHANGSQHADSPVLELRHTSPVERSLRCDGEAGGGGNARRSEAIDRSRPRDNGRRSDRNNVRSCTLRFVRNGAPPSHELSHNRPQHNYTPCPVLLHLLSYYEYNNSEGYAEPCPVTAACRLTT